MASARTEQDRPELPPDLREVLAQLDATAARARSVAEGLDDEAGAWRPRPGSWSVAECLDHLAATNRVYLAALREGAERARRAGRRRRGPARPGLVGRWFVRLMEPPVRARVQARPSVVPRPVALSSALPAFLASQDEVRAFLADSAELDLAGTRFVNPFVRGVRFSLATGLHVIPAHERRHLWQAAEVRRARGA